MGTPRKTIDLETVVDFVNARNARSTCSPDQREGWNSLLASMLSESNQYNGFRYLKLSEVPEGQEAGIIRTGTQPFDNTFPDPTRKHYYMRRYDNE